MKAVEDELKEPAGKQTSFGEEKEGLFDVDADDHGIHKGTGMVGGDDQGGIVRDRGFILDMDLLEKYLDGNPNNKS